MILDEIGATPERDRALAAVSAARAASSAAAAS
jgi:hypothetical protein